MKFYCAQCANPIVTGARMCGCGSIWDHPVPDERAPGWDDIGAFYWPPHQPSSSEYKARQVQNSWESIAPRHKAVAFGGLAVVLILAAIGTYRSPFVSVGVPPQQALILSPQRVPMPPAPPVPVVLAPPPVYSPSTAAPTNVQPQSPYPQAQPSMPPEDFFSPQSVAQRERANAEQDRASAEQQMQTAMEPKEKEFPTTPEGQRDAMAWRKQVMEDRARTVGQIQQRIDRDNDTINGH